MRKEVFITNNALETQKLGKGFLKSHSLGLQVKTPGALVIGLYGDLGSGKTTFVKGLARGLGITRRVISPTFIVVRSYNLKSQISNLKITTQNLKLFYHIDLYRIDSKKDLKGLGIEEIINDPQNIVAIEWVEKMGDLLPRDRWDVRFEYLSKDRRRIVIKKFESQNSKSETISKFK